jgi:hypothetical protein
MKLQLKRSLRLDNGAAQAPSAEQMGFGELAINYAQEDPTIFLKDNNNVIRKLRLSLLPEASNASIQAGTLDERYLKLDGGTMTGTLTGTEFVGGVARISQDAPATGESSELWWNADNGRLYIRYNDQWVDASPDSFTMGTDFYSKTDTDTEISTAISALSSGAVATNAAAISALQSGLTSEESTRLAAVAEKMDVAGGTFTGPVSFDASIIAKGDGTQAGEITLNCQHNSHGIKVQGPDHSASANYTLVLPPNTGSSGQFLTTDGSGNTTWTSQLVTDLSSYDTSAQVDAKISNLVNGAPGALDTLNELAAAMGDDANFASSMTNALSLKANASSLASVATSGSYNDLSNKPSIPTVNNGTITFRTYGHNSNANAFTVNQSHNETITLPQIRYTDLSGQPFIPTHTSHITNNSGYITGGTEAATASTVVQRDSGGDIHCRLLRPNYQNQSNISGAIAFRVNTSSDNYLRFCSDPAAVRGWLGAGTSSFNGDYNSLSNRPFIPTHTSHITNNSGYLTSHQSLGNYNNTSLYTFDSSGNFTANGNVTAYSDITLKECIAVIPNALEKVCSIRGVTFNRNDMEGSPRHAGVIAQEVETVLPEVVSTNEEGIKSVAYGNLVGLLVEAVKELKEEVQSLKAERN